MEDVEGGVRTVLMEAVRATDEALRGLGRAERNADPDARIEIRRVQGEVRQSARLILESLLGSVEAETGRHGHSRRVASTARAIAEAMLVPPNEVARIEDASRLHDVGELLLDWEQMCVHRELIPAERRSLRRHPTIGQRLLPTVGLDEESCRIVGAHHERLDGSGYPDRLIDVNVPIGAQVLAVADAFEAMTHSRPHRAGLSPSEAIENLRHEAHIGRLNEKAVAALDEIVRGSG
jgi:HD-GYP domain-containing protein (c-di-GMP phosphodiesterase class II)